jgi:hypothetical protein
MSTATLTAVLLDNSFREKAREESRWLSAEANGEAKTLIHSLNKRVDSEIQTKDSAPLKKGK